MIILFDKVIIGSVLASAAKINITNISQYYPKTLPE